MKGDLLRARGLVGDATERLFESTQALSSSVSQYQILLTEMQQTLFDPTRSEATLAGASSVLLREFVDNMVRVSRDSIATIEQIYELSHTIVRLVKSSVSLDKLARETRLIALNARIETQRAGDAGRTFKVLADEVKRMSSMSLDLSDTMGGSVEEVRVRLESVRNVAAGLASHDMSSALRAHSGLNAAITQLTGLQGQIEAELVNVQAHVGQVIRALQFEDMVAQILTATADRIATLERLMVRAVDVMAEGSHGHAELEAIAYELQDSCSHHAVKQSTVEAGTAELF